jgi:hypothetical protein
MIIGFQAEKTAKSRCAPGVLFPDARTRRLVRVPSTASNEGRTGAGLRRVER